MLAGLKAAEGVVSWLVVVYEGAQRGNKFRAAWAEHQELNSEGCTTPVNAAGQPREPGGEQPEPPEQPGGERPGSRLDPQCGMCLAAGGTYRICYRTDGEFPTFPLDRSRVIYEGCDAEIDPCPDNGQLIDVFGEMGCVDLFLAE